MDVLQTSEGEFAVAAQAAGSTARSTISSPRSVSRPRLLGVGSISAAALMVVAGCGSSSSDTRPVEASASATPTSPGESETYRMPDGSFSVELPPGFVARAEPLSGPLVEPGANGSAQTFINEPASQQLVVSVARGLPADAATDATKPPYPQPSTRQVQGRDTYVFSVDMTKQRVLLWVIDSTTVAHVIGTNMTEDELFSVGEGVRVSADGGGGE